MDYTDSLLLFAAALYKIGRWIVPAIIAAVILEKATRGRKARP